ncbi:MAG TPA: glycosyltransferase [Burkholderiaceae bacterium]
MNAEAAGRPTKTIVISGVNLVEGGPLTVFRDCIAAATQALPGWRVVVLAHDAKLITTPGVEVMAFPKAKSRWLRRLALEWHGMRPLSRELRADLWLCMHDMTARVDARRQAVYCHNPSPFSRATWRDALFSPTYFAFSLLYRYLYGAFIHRNHAVVVQQEWLRRCFQRLYGVERVIVAHPQPEVAQAGVKPARQGPGNVFFFPALPRSFKNFEVIGEAVALLEQDPAWQGKVRWTLSGDENRYAAWLRRRFGHLRSIEWIGLQTREQMQAQYDAVDCLLFPSRVETWGLPLSEGKRHGLPLIAADLPYAHETVGNCDAVAYFDVQDPADLARRMAAFENGEQPCKPARLDPPAAPFAPDWIALLKLLAEGL